MGIRHKIFSVKIKDKKYLIRAVDGCAASNILTQMGLRKFVVKRSPGKAHRSMDLLYLRNVLAGRQTEKEAVRWTQSFLRSERKHWNDQIARWKRGVW